MLFLLKNSFGGVWICLIYFCSIFWFKWRPSNSTSTHTTNSGSTTVSQINHKNAENKSTSSSKTSINSKIPSVFPTSLRLGQEKIKSKIILPQRKNPRPTTCLLKISRGASPQKCMHSMTQDKIKPHQWRLLEHFSSRIIQERRYWEFTASHNDGFRACISEMM